MSITVCIPSRGRPELLRQTVATMLGTACERSTTISVALDSDDPHLSTTLAALDTLIDPGNQVVVSVARRADALGEKWNRAARTAKADNYLIWADDMVIPDNDWDTTLQIENWKNGTSDNVVFFGSIPGVMQPGILVPEAFIKAMGFLAPPYFSFWWTDTWVLECAVMSGRFVQIGDRVKVELLQPLASKSRGVREIKFWADLFDAMRPDRVRAAKKLNPNAQTEALEAAFLQSNKPCSDPVSAARLEQIYAFDNEPDERYLRLKAKAEAILTKASEA